MVGIFLADDIGYGVRYCAPNIDGEKKGEFEMEMICRIW
jgi:hypothetical protein